MTMHWLLRNVCLPVYVSTIKVIELSKQETCDKRFTLVKQKHSSIWALLMKKTLLYMLMISN